MPWTQASNPVNTNQWLGDCSQLDLFTVTVPVQPGDSGFTPVSAYDTNNIHFMDGFEYPSAYYTTDGSLWDGVGSPATNGSISTDVRDTALTAGHSLQIVSTASAGVYYGHPTKPLSPTYQYLRVYVKVVSATNANGSLRAYTICGWNDNTGFRSTAKIVFPAAGGTSALKFGVEHPVFSAQTTGTANITIGTWYRIELITERTSTSYTTTANIYVGDSSTVFDTIAVSGSGVAMGGFPFIACESGAAGNALTLRFDDLRVQTALDTIPTAAVNSPKFGPGGIWALYPSGVNTTEWTPLSGTNWSNVDEFPLATFDDDTSYISDANTTSKTDIYDVSVTPNTLPNHMYIKAAMVRARYKNTAGTPSVRTVYQDGLGTNYLGSQDVAGGTYESSSYSFLMYPTGLPTELVGVQGIGINHVASAASTVRCTSSWGLIDVAQQA